MPSMSYTMNNEGSSAPLDLSTYTRSMHYYTFAQLNQMRAAIANVGETANGTMKDRDEADRVEQESQ